MVHVANILPGFAAAVSVHTILSFIVLWLNSHCYLSAEQRDTPLSARNGGKKLRTVVGPPAGLLPLDFGNNTEAHLGRRLPLRTTSWYLHASYLADKTHATCIGIFGGNDTDEDNSDETVTLTELKQTKPLLLPIIPSPAWTVTRWPAEKDPESSCVWTLKLG